MSHGSKSDDGTATTPRSRQVAAVAVSLVLVVAMVVWSRRDPDPGLEPPF